MSFALKPLIPVMDPTTMNTLRSSLLVMLLLFAYTLVGCDDDSLDESPPQSATDVSAASTSDVSDLPDAEDSESDAPDEDGGESDPPDEDDSSAATDVPGPEETAQLAPSSVSINEVVAKSATDMPDWVELYNAGDAATDLSGWLFKDDDDEHIYTFPEGTVIEPKAYLLMEKEQGEHPFDFGLGSDDAARLFDADEVLVSVLDWEDGQAPEGSSYGRSPDGSETVGTLPEVTPGAANGELASP